MALFPKFASTAPSADATAIGETAMAPAGLPPAARESRRTGLPLLGRMPLARQQRLLLVLMIAALLLLGGGLAVTLRASSASAGLLNDSGDAAMQSQRVAKSISAALLGSSAAFTELRSSAEALRADMHTLRGGAALAKARPLVDSTVKNAGTVVALESVLTQTNQALRGVSSQSDAMLEPAQTVLSLLQQSNAPAADVGAAAQLVMLTQRLGKSANEFLSYQGVSPGAVFALGKDLNTFNQLLTGLLDGDASQQLVAVRDAQARQQLAALQGSFAATRKLATAVLGNLQALTNARLAQAAVVKDSVPLLDALQQLQHGYSSAAGGRSAGVLFVAACGFVALFALLGLAQLYVADTRQRAQQAERQRLQAERLELEARRSNEANQSAILRLMNELQNVAEGDLTQQATVTEDITGAIADSVNYTVEELRSLVGQVQSSAEQVRAASAQAQTTSSELLKSSEQQLAEIRATGRSVLEMAERINTVSAQAQQSSDVARQSLRAAEQGQLAVRNSIDGMNTIRSQIQDTSKRIKRLGESSQEIGEITELISDLTEQTNVLALNAAIQAASAGDAGRGFSVVAEEVQRLAERSADAAKQIAALVRAIQTDTQDAVAAMEKSTQGVVEGARLSDSAGTALSEIDRVSRELAELIQRIAGQAQTEAQSANQVAENIQHIFVVTEQTEAGTRSTAELIAELARVAGTLRDSVTRFKIS
ncbi:methyl-accepting chemotaxis protein PctA [mine drainage metagenome]|jgi:twitching motility protein PilJ|uniref:Methyl-accepting chemotaxis protein PctA n=1 Tax=mine drainage metagenome TaxID=410659 RepID=A0A1J5R383_9ZZZZ